MQEVLLLEHNPIDAETIISVMKQVNPSIHVEWVRTSRAALDFVFSTGTYAARTQDQAPRLILLDVTFSRTEGLDLLNILKSYARTRVLPVVILTDTPNHTAFFAQANSCIVKTSSATDSEEYCRALELIGRYWLTMNKSVERLDDQSSVDESHEATTR
jgi:two-component system, response regulator